MKVYFDGIVLRVDRFGFYFKMSGITNYDVIDVINSYSDSAGFWIKRTGIISYIDSTGRSWRG